MSKPIKITSGNCHDAYRFFTQKNSSNKRVEVSNAQKGHSSATFPKSHTNVETLEATCHILKHSEEKYKFIILRKLKLL